MRIGIVGGSFNPIHIAHLIIADRFAEQMQLNTCTFIPAFQSPFKSTPNVADATPKQRMDMVRAAIALNGCFSASDREIERGGVSYTIDTVEDLQHEHPNAELFLLIGSDQAIEFVRWHRWEDICRKARLCIVRRPFLLTNEMELRTTERLTIDGREPIWINAPLLEISSTEIRHRVSKGATINYLTVKAVRDYIESHGLYRSEHQ